jgi:hypothetical protein
MRKTKRVIKRKLKLNKTNKKRTNHQKKSKRMSRKGGNKEKLIDKVNLAQMIRKLFNDAVEEEGGYDKMTDTSFVTKWNDLNSKWLRATNLRDRSVINKIDEQMNKMTIQFGNKLYSLFKGKYPKEYIFNVMDMSKPYEVLLEMYLGSIYPFNLEYDMEGHSFPEEEKPYNKFRIDVIEPKYPGNKPMQKWQMVKNYVSPVGRNFIGRKIWANGNILSLDELEFWLIVFKIRKELEPKLLQEWVDGTAKLSGPSDLEKLFKYPGMEGTPKQIQEVIDQIQEEIDDYTF